jgi:hypothetical protein
MNNEWFLFAGIIFVILYVAYIAPKAKQYGIFGTAAVAFLVLFCFLVGFGVVEIGNEQEWVDFDGMIKIIVVLITFAVLFFMALDSKKKYLKSLSVKEKQQAPAESTQPDDMSSPSVALSGKLNTPLARKVFARAIKRGMIVVTKDHYDWQGQAVLLAYMLGRIYCGDAPKEDNRNRKCWYHGNMPMPRMEVEKLFARTGLSQLRFNYKDELVPENAESVDALF